MAKNRTAFSKPVIFTDFDGVLNTFPDSKVLRRGGVNKVLSWAKPDSPYAKLYDPANAFHTDGNEVAHTPEGSWRIHWSSELSDAMYRLAADGLAELYWLSTWQPYCEQQLDPLLGWDPQLVEVVTWYDPITNAWRGTGKWQTFCAMPTSKTAWTGRLRSSGSTMTNAPRSGHGNWRSCNRKRQFS